MKTADCASDPIATIRFLEGSDEELYGGRFRTRRFELLILADLDQIAVGIAKID
jgi:hypothetical protein